MVDQAIAELSQRTWKDGSRGVCASFFSLSDTWGVKIYRRPDVADACYDSQKIGIDCGIAPRLGDRVELSMIVNAVTGQKETVYGFITEKAVLASELVCDYMGIERMTEGEMNKQGVKEKLYSLCGYGLRNFEFDETIDKHWKELNSILKEGYKHPERHMREFFANCVSDLHCFNWGVIDNRPVVIDFSFG